MFGSRSQRVRGLRLLMAIALLAASLLSGAAQVAAASDDPGAVYTITNNASSNAVTVFARAADGTLTARDPVATGGLGTGAALGSQGAVTLTEDGRWLFVVNAGSNDISSFAVLPDGLHRVGTFPSGGIMPISLTTHGDILYVVNAGGSGNIAGFRIDRGALTPILGSMQPLSNGGTGAAPGPAQIQFNASGTVLVVTEKATSVIDTYVVGSDGAAGAPSVYPSAGATPFGFDIDRQDHVVVSEAAASTASSYALGRDGSVTAISPVVPDNGVAACWVAIAKNGRFAYVANAASNSLSRYDISQDGSLTLAAEKAAEGMKPLDMAITNNGSFLYVLDAAAHVVMGFRVQADGSLTPLHFDPALVSGLGGLAAR